MPAQTESEENAQPVVDKRTESEENAQPVADKRTESEENAQPVADTRNETSETDNTPSQQQILTTIFKKKNDPETKPDFFKVAPNQQSFTFNGQKDNQLTLKNTNSICSKLQTKKEI